ncbi:MAG: alpha/beta fold hydrolase [Pseudomonadota bacterium]
MSDTGGPEQPAQEQPAAPAAQSSTEATVQSTAASIEATPAANTTYKAPGAQGIALNAALGVDRQSFADTWRDLLGAAAAQPRAVFDTALELQGDMLSIVLGNSPLEPDPRDARFADEAWTHNPLYRRVGQAYLAWAKSLDSWLDRSGMAGMDRARARFVFDAAKEVFAPVNLLPTNPGALRQARDTRGQSILSGVRNFIDDLRHNHGYPAAADRDGFVIGREVAASPGAVVFRNELFELIQYQPNTEQVAAEPFLYVFSQVNRFYLGDLTPDRSMFQRLLDAGHPVFAVSWRNPTAEQRDWNLGTYADGVIEAISVMRDITGGRKVNLMGLCAGGINAAMAAALLAGRGDDWVNSLSLFVNVLDNRTEDSDFGLFVSERSVAAQKERVRMKGIYDEKDVYEMFAMLRWEDNIMSFLRRNYLMGEAPLKHPLLFWSIDYTRVPAGLHTDFLDLSLDNRLAKNEFMALGKRLKLSDIRCPVYLMAGSTDHITPWRACYRSTQLFGGPVKFVLTNQNHTQTISARTDNKHLKYWVGDQLPVDAEAWAEGAREYPGSWMFDWIAWLDDQSPERAPAAAELGSENYPVIDSSPGRYVLE